MGHFSDSRAHKLGSLRAIRGLPQSSPWPAFARIERAGRVVVGVVGVEDRPGRRNAGVASGCHGHSSGAE